MLRVPIVDRKGARERRPEPQEKVSASPRLGRPSQPAPAEPSHQRETSRPRELPRPHEPSHVSEPPRVSDHAARLRSEPIAAAEPHPLDRVLLVLTLMLVGVGVVMVYSSSTVIGAARFHSAGFFMLRQVVYTAIGLIVFAAAARVPVDVVRRSGPILLGVGLVLLIAVLTTQSARNGARRWIDVFGLVSFQPSELVKFAVVLFLADRLARQQERLASFAHGLVPHLVILAVLLGLIVLEPNLSTAVAIALIAGVLMICAQVRVRHLFLLLLIAAPLIALLILMEPYRVVRLVGFLPIMDRADPTTYQIQQGFVALGSGGLFGRGLGRSLQKFYFLPEPYTDSIYPIIGEEFGLVGTLAVLGLYAAFGWRGVQIARRQATLYRLLLAVGLTASVMVYAALNIAVMTGLLPATGLPLPFISYGGSALLFNLTATGLLLGLSRERRVERAGFERTVTS